MGYAQALHALLRKHFSAWRRHRGYLGVSTHHYNVNCPPLLFVGGAHVAENAEPLVVVSIEPLQTWHFNQQSTYASDSLACFTEWNLNFFRRFPQLTRPSPQRYWRAMSDFVEGWADSKADRCAPWPLFERTLIELPYVPMHARRHDPAASRSASPALRELFAERAALIVHRWPGARFVVLSARIADELHDAGLVLDPHPMKIRRVATFGTGFTVPVEAAYLKLDGDPRPRLLLRRGPFSYMHNPNRAGRHALGRRLRIA